MSSLGSELTKYRDEKFFNKKHDTVAQQSISFNNGPNLNAKNRLLVIALT
jgi:hypothetical protein